MKADLIERYAANLHGVLSCFDRILITGTLPGACYAAGMTSFLNAHGIRIFDYAGFAEPLRERIRVTSTRATAKRKIWWHACGGRVAMHPGWCTSSRRWRPARATSRGTTR